MTTPSNESKQKTKATMIKTQVSDTMEEIKSVLGAMPEFAERVPKLGVVGTWQEVRDFLRSSQTAIPLRYKDIVNFAVSTQIPCPLSVDFGRKVALADGVSKEELREAVQVVGIIRHWSTFLNGIQLNEKRFQDEVQKIIQGAKAAGDKMLELDCSAKNFASVDEVYDDIQTTLGFVPEFMQLYPKEAIAGSWNLFKGVQMNPKSLIPSKYKELIGIAVSAQIPCRYCSYFHTEFAKNLFGASDREVSEAAALSAETLYWSVIWNGLDIDQDKFRSEAGQLAQSMAENIQQLQ